MDQSVLRHAHDSPKQRPMASNARGLAQRTKHDNVIFWTPFKLLPTGQFFVARQTREGTITLVNNVLQPLIRVHLVLQTNPP